VTTAHLEQRHGEKDEMPNGKQRLKGHRKIGCRRFGFGFTLIELLVVIGMNGYPDQPESRRFE
jgi:hypothetical protein